MLVPVDIGSISYVSYTNNTDDTPHTVKILREIIINKNDFFVFLLVAVVTYVKSHRQTLGQQKKAKNRENVTENISHLYLFSLQRLRPCPYSEWCYCWSVLLVMVLLLSPLVVGWWVSKVLVVGQPVTPLSV